MPGDTLPDRRILPARLSLISLILTVISLTQIVTLTIKTITVLMINLVIRETHNQTVHLNCRLLTVNLDVSVTVERATAMILMRMPTILADKLVIVITNQCEQSRISTAVQRYLFQDFP